MTTSQDKVAARPKVTIKASANGNYTKAIDAVASRRGLSVLIVGLLAFVGSATIGLIDGIAEPTVQDEFSYLLAADTFAHGRLTNPTHPMWVHFESIHIIHQPTYMSKYPPGQGVILTLGQLLSGHPIVGVWLSMGLMCAAICWMLHAWVPARWALIGGLFSVLHPVVGIGGDAAQSYWGGALPAAGGALVLGATRYLLTEPKVCHALLMGLGLIVLANTRPYEGFLVGVCAVLTLLMGFIGKRDLERSVLVEKIVLPLLLICTAAGVWMGYYNFRVTGNIFRMPYQVHEATYGVAPLFVWQEPSPTPDYRHAAIRKFHTQYELAIYQKKHSLMGFIKVNLDALLMYFYLAGHLFAISWIVNFPALICWTLRDPWARNAFTTYSIVTIGLMFATYLLMHYWAPIFALNYYFTVQAIRLWRQRDRRLRPLIVPVMFCLLGMLLIITVKRRIGAEVDPLSAQAQRASLLAQLEHQAGKHVVLVKYGPEHFGDLEWVYNKADIDQAKVVWAHDMDRKENCKLVDYFKDRMTWSLNIEHDHVFVKFNPFPRHLCS